MKIMFSTFILFAFLLNACATPATATNIPISSTETITPQVPTTKTEKPTTPTETPDPNKPPDATGRKVVDGEWVYTKEGADKVTYFYTGFKDLEGMPIWASDHVINPTYKGGIQAMDDFGSGPLISIRYSVKEGMTAPYLSHENSDTSLSGATFSKIFYTTLMERDLEKSFRKMSTEEVVIFGENYNNGTVSITVINARGNSFELPINDETKVNIILVKPGDFPDDFNSEGIHSNTSFEKDAEGNITIVNILVANDQSIESLGPQDFMNCIFRPFFRIIANKDQSMATYLNSAESTKIWAKIGNLERSLISGPNPHFIVKDTPTVP